MPTNAFLTFMYLWRLSPRAMPSCYGGRRTKCGDVVCGSPVPAQQGATGAQGAQGFQGFQGASGGADDLALAFELSSGAFVIPSATILTIARFPTLVLARADQSVTTQVALIGDSTSASHVTSSQDGTLVATAVPIPFASLPLIQQLQFARQADQDVTFTVLRVDPIFVAVSIEPPGTEAEFDVVFALFRQDAAGTPATGDSYNVLTGSRLRYRMRIDAAGDVFYDPGIEVPVGTAPFQGVPQSATLNLFVSLGAPGDKLAFAAYMEPAPDVLFPVATVTVLWKVTATLAYQPT